MYSPFTDTKNMFTQATSYTGPLSYDQWVDTPDDLKAAVLYLQFYDQITLAWYKADTLQRGSAEDGVSTVLQYLEKNVSKIVASRSKFTPSYIYRVAYNCLYCICHDILRDKERFAHEICNLVPSADGEAELNLYDLAPYQDEDISVTQLKDRLWSTIDEMGPEAQAVVSKLIGEDVGKRVPRVSAKRREEVVAELRARLVAFQDVQFS